MTDQPATAMMDMAITPGRVTAADWLCLGSCHTTVDIVVDFIKGPLITHPMDPVWTPRQSLPDLHSVTAQKEIVHSSDLFLIFQHLSSIILAFNT